ncbi:MAG: glycoside hydrolase family 16 protein [Candidatus Methylacidiphilales bacterium]|nr:glycoside hydrolase family 16 protein [Candidatus Methylacidiphilales bacterium]
MKIRSATQLGVALGLCLWMWMTGFASAESTPASPAPGGKRPKFTSKIHIPVRLATEVTPLPPAGYELVFTDEFNGNDIDTKKWGFRLESKLLSTQQRENVSVKDGNLVIALRKESVNGKDFTAGGVISRQTFVYGFYEARFKTPPAEGWHTAFWAMKKSFPDQPAGPPALLELDFCEQDGGDPHFFSFGIINQSRYHQKKNRQSWNAGRWVIEDAPDTSAGFHVWACEFTPQTTRFYFDGKLSKELSSAGFPHDAMSVWFSAIASTLKGDRWVDESKLPNEVLCDYIRVYQHPKHREAEDAVRAEILRPLPLLKNQTTKDTDPLKPKLEDLN